MLGWRTLTSFYLESLWASSVAVRALFIVRFTLTLVCWYSDSLVYSHSTSSKLPSPLALPITPNATYVVLDFEQCSDQMLNLFMDLFHWTFLHSFRWTSLILLDLLLVIDHVVFIFQCEACFIFLICSVRTFFFTFPQCFRDGNVILSNTGSQSC